MTTFFSNLINRLSFRRVEDDLMYESVDPLIAKLKLAIAQMFKNINPKETDFSKYRMRFDYIPSDNDEDYEELLKIGEIVKVPQKFFAGCITYPSMISPNSSRLIRVQTDPNTNTETYIRYSLSKINGKLQVNETSRINECLAYSLTELLPKSKSSRVWRSTFRKYHKFYVRHMPESYMQPGKYYRISYMKSYDKFFPMYFQLNRQSKNLNSTLPTTMCIVFNPDNNGVQYRTVPDKSNKFEYDYFDKTEIKWAGKFVMYYDSEDNFCIDMYIHKSFFTIF